MKERDAEREAQEKRVQQLEEMQRKEQEEQARRRLEEGKSLFQTICIIDSEPISHLINWNFATKLVFTLKMVKINLKK